MILIKKVTACEEKQKRVYDSLLPWKEVKKGVKIPTSAQELVGGGGGEVFFKGLHCTLHSQHSKTGIYKVLGFLFFK